MAVYNSNSSIFNGKQINNTFLPTYTSSGVDGTEWGWILQRFRRQSGANARPNPMYIEGMARISFQFKGLRCTKTSALDDYLPTEEENNRKWFKNVPNQSHYDKLTEIHHVVSNTKKRRTEADIPRLCPETVHSDGSNRTEGNV